MSDALIWRVVISKWRFRYMIELFWPRLNAWRSKRFWLGMVCLLFGFQALASDNSALASSQTISVITHASNPLDRLSLRELRASYAMKKRSWEEGTPITVFVLGNDHELHKEFCKKQLNIFPNQLESIWYRQIYTGTGQAPRSLSSEQEMIQRVSNTPGAIGYIYNNNDQKILSNENIKILTIY